MEKEPTMWVKVLKCKDANDNEIARADAFGGSVHVYTINWMDGYGLYPTDTEEEIFGGSRMRQRLPRGSSGPWRWRPCWTCSRLST